MKIDYRHKVHQIARTPGGPQEHAAILLMGMGEKAGHSEESKDALIRAIEEKAGHLEYRAGREGMYDELEGLLPDKDYHAVLSIIDHGYALLEDEPITNKIAREVWDFSQYLSNLAEAKHKELAGRYPEWFNESIKLQVKVTHPLSHSPFEGTSPEGKNTVMRQLSDYLRPYFVTKIGIAKMIAQIFLYFYGRDYPEVDPKKICEIIWAPYGRISKGRGIVLNEPSVVAVRKGDQGANKVLAVGEEAKRMLGRTPGDIVTTRPMKDGVIADFDITQTMLSYFIRKVHNRRSVVRPRIVICVPSGVTQVEKRAVRESAESAGAREVFLIKEPMAAAIGADLPVTEPACNIVVDIGAGTTEVAIISLAGMVYSHSMRVAGDRMDEAILQHIKRKHKLLIGLQTAELIKVTIGNAYPTDGPERIDVKGRDLVTGTPKILTIDSQEISEAISEQVGSIVETVRIALEQTPPELSADAVDRGIVLTGGGALLKNLDVLLRQEVQLPITITDDPLTTIALGAGKALDNLSMLKEISVN